MKHAQISMILAVELRCPECGGICDDLERGSSMILDDVQVVVCEDFLIQLSVPKAAFSQPTRSHHDITKEG